MEGWDEQLKLIANVGNNFLAPINIGNIWFILNSASVNIIYWFSFQGNDRSFDNSLHLDCLCRLVWLEVPRRDEEAEFQTMEQCFPQASRELFSVCSSLRKTNNGVLFSSPPLSPLISDVCWPGSSKGERPKHFNGAPPCKDDSWPTDLSTTLNYTFIPLYHYTSTSLNWSPWKTFNETTKGLESKITLSSTHH